MQNYHARDTWVVSIEWHHIGILPQVWCWHVTRCNKDWPITCPENLSHLNHTHETKTHYLANAKRSVLCSCQQNTFVHAKITSPPQIIAMAKHPCKCSQQIATHLTFVLHKSMTKESMSWSVIRLMCPFRTFFSHICRGLDPILYMMDKNPLWYEFLNMVVFSACCTLQQARSYNPGQRRTSQIIRSRHMSLSSNSALN